MMKPAFYRHGHFAFDWYRKLHCDIIWTCMSCDEYRLSVTREWGAGGTPMWQSTLKGLFSHCNKIYLKWYFDTNISPNVYVQEHLEIPPSQYEYDFQSCQLCSQRRICLTFPVASVRAHTVDRNIVCLRPFHLSSDSGTLLYYSVAIELHSTKALKSFFPDSSR